MSKLFNLYMEADAYQMGRNDFLQKFGNQDDVKSYFSWGEDDYVHCLNLPKSVQDKIDDCGNGMMRRAFVEKWSDLTAESAKEFWDSILEMGYLAPYGCHEDGM
jgi:hypothetical protein